MGNLQDLIREKERVQKIKERARIVQKNKEKLSELKENGKAITKELEKDYPLVDFQKLSETSDFKRLIYRGITGETWRGTNKGLEKELSKKLIKVQE